MEEFHCPECGDFRFGTSNCTSPEKELIGECHGDHCNFKWPRKDDHLYFRANVNVQKLESIKSRIQALVDLNPGDVWTEYHWREVLQLQQEFNLLDDELC